MLRRTMAKLYNYVSDTTSALYDYANYDGSANENTIQIDEKQHYLQKQQQQHHIVVIEDDDERKYEPIREESSEDNFYAEIRSEEENQAFYEEKTDERALEEKIDGLVILVEEKYPNHRSEKRQNIAVVYTTFKNRAVKYINETDFEYLEDDSNVPITSEMIESERPYLRPSVSNNFMPLRYSDIFNGYEDCIRSEECRPIGSDGKTFFVNASLDYIYSFVLEKALLEDIYPELYKKSLENFSRRRNSFVACQGDHFSNGIKLCSKEWIIYTQLNSSFAIRCMKFLRESEFIDYTQDTPFSTTGREYVSFHLVLFLCGEHIQGLHDSIPEPSTSISTTTTTTTTIRKENVPIDNFNFSASDGNEMSAVVEEPEEQEIDEYEKKLLYYTDTNRWIKLPLWFYDVWRKCIEADAAK